MPDVAVRQRELLRIADLHAWYGESHILHGMNFAVAAGEVVTLLGRNGVGKTTPLNAIMGVIAQRRASGGLGWQKLISPPSNQVARHGIPWGPEARPIST